MRRLIQVLVFCALSTTMWAQSRHRYTYDDSGNRVRRELTYLFTPDDVPVAALKWQPKDSLKTNSASEPRLFKVYPNPNNGQFQVSTDNLKEGTWLELVDMSGRQIHQQGITESITKVDITHVGAGSFLLICRDKTQVFGRWKVITQ
jgi:Secretion system C-terminal sorting domain